MNYKFTKNYYYNKTSILKLIYLYNYINNKSLLEDLSVLIEKNSFLPCQPSSQVLTVLYSNLFSNTKKLEFPFGFLWMFEDKLVFYFKSDFELEEFFTFFSNLYKDYQITWASMEVFDKNIKILEIFSKPQLMRSFRNESDDSKKNFKPTLTTINCQNSDFLMFLSKYNAKNLKLIVYFFFEKH